MTHQAYQIRLWQQCADWPYALLVGCAAQVHEYDTICITSYGVPEEVVVCG